MAGTLRAGIIGCGWPGAAHARGYAEAGGFKVVAAADLIPARRQKLLADAKAPREYADADALIADPDVDVVSICLPNHLHAHVTLAALKAGKHVVCEKPPAISAREAKQIAAAAAKRQRVVLYALQRRFGAPELAARQAVAKGYAGEVYHARAAWMRTRGIPLGTGWFTDKARSGGGALADLGVHMLDLAWHLLGEPTPKTVFASTHSRFRSLVPSDMTYDVEDAAFALLKFEGGKTIELSASWALNQPPQQQGAVCRIFGDSAAVDVYTADGAVLHRGFNDKGESKPVALKPPRLQGHAMLMRHLRECILGKAVANPGPEQGVLLMQMLEALYESAESGRSVNVR